MRRLLAPLFLVSASLIAAESVQAETTLLPIDVVRSTVLAITRPSGLLGKLGLAGDDHAVIAVRFFITLRVDPADVRRSYVHVTLPTAGLEVDTSEARRIAGLGSGTPSEEVISKFRQALLGRSGLDAGPYPEIRYESDTIEPLPGKPAQIEEGKSLGVRISGTLELRGSKHPLAFEASIDPAENNTLRLSGKMKIKQSELGLSIPGAREEIEILFEIRTKPAIAVASSK